MANQRENWHSGHRYERFMGRWSRLVADSYLLWLNQGESLNWLDVGCGTGALSQRILDTANPKCVYGVDLSVDFASHAQTTIADGRFLACDAQKLPFKNTTFDAVVSGIALNFVPQPLQAVSEMKRIAKSGHVVSAYVWDYAGKMEFLRYFWDAAVALDSSARTFDEGLRFPICQPQPLQRVFEDAGLSHVEVESLDIPTLFQDFDDYWQPFTLGNFPAPKYAMSLSEEKRSELQRTVYESLPLADDGTINLIARVWAVRGIA